MKTLSIASISLIIGSLCVWAEYKSVDGRIMMPWADSLLSPAAAEGAVKVGEGDAAVVHLPDLLGIHTASVSNFFANLFHVS